MLRIAPSSVQELCPEPTGLRPKRRSKPRVAKHRAGPMISKMISKTGAREVGRFLRRIAGAVKLAPACETRVYPVEKWRCRIGRRTVMARKAVIASSTATAMNTAVQLPVICLRKAAAGPPRIEPTPWAI